MRCGTPLSYENMNGWTPHARTMDFLRRGMWQWLPKPCPDCGKRFGNHDQCDQIPF